MRFGTRALVVTAAVVLGAGFGLGRASARVRGDTVTGVFGVGGVIVQHGTDAVLWQYLPDDKKWQTIDAAFKRDGRETHVLPLPVPAAKIRAMESWGFLVTTDGQIWHYDIDDNKWHDIGMP